MKLFVTGGTGFLGRHVVQACLDAGHEVHYLSHRPRKPLEGAVPVEVSLFDEAALSEALQGMDAVLHLAGKVSRQVEDSALMHRIHVEGSKTLLEAMVKAKVRRILLASTSGTLAVSESGGYLATEDDRPDFELIGRWPYYTSKLLQEQELSRYLERGDLEGVFLHPSLLLGPGDLQNSSTDDVLDILNRRVPATTRGTVAFVDVRDCAPAFVAALTAESGRHYLLNGANMSVRRFASRVAVAGDIRPPRLQLPRGLALTGARLLDGLAKGLNLEPSLDPVSVEMAGYHWGCDASRAQKELGFQARDPQITINDTVKDLVSRGLYRKPRT